MALVRPVFHRLSCSNETVQNAPKHEFWVQWSGSGAFVAKIPMQLRLANFCVNRDRPTGFASTFMQLRNGPKRTETCGSGLMEWIRCVRCEKF
jgi:hypothetical protein